MKRQERQAEKRQARADRNPRAVVHENKFPDAPEAFAGIARTLSSGLE